MHLIRFKNLIFERSIERHHHFKTQSTILFHQYTVLVTVSTSLINIMGVPKFK
jgi:hypothetical protein